MLIKDAIEQIHSHMGQFEDALRGLENQNLADIIGSAKGKLSQAMQHADAERDISEIEPKPLEPKSPADAPQDMNGRPPAGEPFDPSKAGA